MGPKRKTSFIKFILDKILPHRTSNNDEDELVSRPTNQRPSNKNNGKGLNFKPKVSKAEGDYCDHWK